MPMKMKKLCNKCGCNKLTDNTYCEEHLKEKNKSKENKNYWHSWYSSSRWRKSRILYLKRHPVCVQCERAAIVVDHIVDHKGSLKLFWDSSNWQALCISCHNKKTYQTNNGRVGGTSKAGS